MSSTFSPFRGTSASFCQRCRNPLSPTTVRCRHCGYDNLPVRSNDPNGRVRLSSQTSWNVHSLQNSNTANQDSNSQWRPVPSDFYPAFSNPGQANASPPGFSLSSQSMTVERRKLNMKKVAALIVILLIFIGMIISGSVAGYRLLTPHQGARHTTSAPPVHARPKEPPLFAESFMNNNQQWDMRSVQGKYLASLDKGNLVLQDDNNKLFPVLLPSGKHFDNFKLFVNAMLSKGDRQNGYGLCIRGTTDPAGNLTSYHRIELYGDSTYAIYKGATDANGNISSTTVVDTTAHAAIRPAGHINQMVVIADGPKMTLIVNGQTVQTFSDSSYASGTIALFISNLPGTCPGAQAKFSHLAIYPANAK